MSTATQSPSPSGARDVQKDRQMSQRRAGLIGGLLIPGRNEFQAQEEEDWIQDVVDMINEGFERT